MDERYFYVYIHKKRRGFEAPTLEEATYAASRVLDTLKMDADHASIYSVNGMDSVHVGTYRPLVGYASTEGVDLCRNERMTSGSLTGMAASGAA